MFGVAHYSPKVRTMLDTIKQNLEQDCSPQAIKNAYDTLKAFQNDADYTDKSALKRPLVILEQKFYSECEAIASTKMDLDQKYKTLTIIKHLMVDIPVNDTTRGIANNIHNRLFGIENARQKSASQ